jgi:hypothetical protein
VIAGELSAAMLNPEVFESDLPIRLRVNLNRILGGTFEFYAFLFDVW